MSGMREASAVTPATRDKRGVGADTPAIWDTHVHLDFIRDAARVAREAQEMGLGLFAVTVTPDGYERTSAKLADASNVRVGVGLHPWWVADGRCTHEDVVRTAQLARESRYIGEVGLDLSPHHVPEGSIDTQVSALEMVAAACAETSDPSTPKVLSLHSVRAAGLTLDVLERTGALATCSCIFHWFSGTSDELHRAVKAGCWFSVNQMLLDTRRGREYARQLPGDRLLLETDLPPGEDVVFSAAEIRVPLERTAERLSEIRGTDVRALTCENSLRLLGH